MYIKINMDIEVEFDGEYPNVCHGKLRVIENGIVIYETKKYVFESTGSAKVTKKCKSIIKQGVLEWCDDDEYNRFLNFVNNHPDKERILAKVKLVMESVKVCCGGCI